jgi:hypothetical protein
MLPLQPKFIVVTAPAPDLQAQLVLSICYNLDVISDLFLSVPFYSDDASGVGSDILLCDKTLQLLTQVLGAQLSSLEVTTGLLRVRSVDPRAVVCYTTLLLLAPPAVDCMR